MKAHFWFLPPIAALLLCGSFVLVSHSNGLPTDNLTSASWWQLAVQRQKIVTHDKQYNACLFGDSISSGLGNSLGAKNFNFALPGMSTVSLIEQLKRLIASHVKCNTAIIAIGTNDAWYGLDDDLFIKNLSESIKLVKDLDTQHIFIVPAFYSTVAASHNPKLAGTLKRVDEINALINQVAAREKLPVEADSILPLYKERSLNENLTIDGVHLNDKGKHIYKEALLKIIASVSPQQPTIINVQPFRPIEHKTPSAKV